MSQPILLSSQGSDRATAYSTSNKIVRCGDRLYAGWLDAPAASGRLTPVRLGCCNAQTGIPEKIITLGYGYDNHCGPALAADSAGRLHAIIGAHHNPFIYRYSDTPDDESSWSEPVALGPYDTYPSLTIDAAGTLHLVHRKMEERWELWYRRKRSGQEWEPWVILARSPLPGYVHYYQSLSVGPGGALHLLLSFNYTTTGRSKDTKGRLAAHLFSEDGGDTWYNEDQRCKLPLGIDTVQPVLHFPDGGLGISNHVIDEQNRLWFFAVTPESQPAQLLRRDDNGWTRIALPESFRKLNFTSGRESSISRDASGTIHLTVGTHAGGEPAQWYSPQHEIFHLALDPESHEHTRLTRLTQSGTEEACWLPTLENWSWGGARPDHRVALAFTQGANGSGGNRNTLCTKVTLLPACPQLLPR